MLPVYPAPNITSGIFIRIASLTFEEGSLIDSKVNGKGWLLELLNEFDIRSEINKSSRRPSGADFGIYTYTLWYHTGKEATRLYIERSSSNVYIYWLDRTDNWVRSRRIPYPTPPIRKAAKIGKSDNAMSVGALHHRSLLAEPPIYPTYPQAEVEQEAPVRSRKTRKECPESTSYKGDFPYVSMTYI